MLWQPEQTDTRKEGHRGARSSEQEHLTQPRARGKVPRGPAGEAWGRVPGTGYLCEDPEGRGASSVGGAGHLPCRWSLEGPRKSASQEAEEGPAGGLSEANLPPKISKTKKLLYLLKPGLTLLVVLVLPGKYQLGFCTHQGVVASWSPHPSPHPLPPGNSFSAHLHVSLWKCFALSFIHVLPAFQSVLFRHSPSVLQNLFAFS